MQTSVNFKSYVEPKIENLLKKKQISSDEKQVLDCLLPFHIHFFLEVSLPGT